MTDDEIRHEHFKDAQARAYEYALLSDGAINAKDRETWRHTATMWAVITNALRRDHGV